MEQQPALFISIRVLHVHAGPNVRMASQAGTASLELLRVHRAVQAPRLYSCALCPLHPHMAFLKENDYAQQRPAAATIKEVKRPAG